VALDVTTDTDALDNKGFSEETCVRCGWRMGQPALNCNNDDTPHRFPSQQTPSSPDTDALLATVREALHPTRHPELGIDHLDDSTRNSLAALDSLAAELEVLSRKLTREIVEHADTDAELERVKAERDDERELVRQVKIDEALLQARLDKARKALQRLGGMTHGEDTMRIIREALKETE